MAAPSRSAGSATDELVGAALVLYRQLPKVERYLAYLPEGPVIDWDADDLGRLARPDDRAPQAAGAFGVRIGPPVVTSRWSADAGQGRHRRRGSASPLSDVPPRTTHDPAGARCVSPAARARLAPPDGRGRVRRRAAAVRLPGPAVDGTDRPPRTTSSAGMNQQWRRNIKKADKAGVEVALGRRRRT